MEVTVFHEARSLANFRDRLNYLICNEWKPFLVMNGKAYLALLFDALMLEFLKVMGPVMKYRNFSTILLQFM